MKRSAKSRYQEIARVYRAQVGRAFTSEEVVDWIVENDLYPVPTIRDEEDLQDAWEARFQEAAATWSAGAKKGESC